MPSSVFSGFKERNNDKEAYQRRERKSFFEIEASFAAH
jgi:hypothetical protein